MPSYEFKQICELRRPIQVVAIRGVVFTADVLANKFTAEVFNDGEAVSLANAGVTGYAIRNDGETVLVTGSASGNTASITLPASAYAVPGQLDIVLKVTADGVTATVGAWRGYVQRSTTDAFVDPGHVVPDITELLSQITAMQQATAAANSAASAATSAANTGASRFVRYDEAQSLTATGKEIALSNIGLEIATVAETQTYLGIT